MSVITPLMLLVYALCIPLAALGVWFVGHRPPMVEDSPDTTDDADSQEILNTPGDPSLIDRLRTLRAQLSPPSRMVSGLCMVLLAYHAAAYVSPDHWFGLKVPLERWYILLGGISLALCGTLAIDRFESSTDQEPPRQ